MHPSAPQRFLVSCFLQKPRALSTLLHPRNLQVLLFLFSLISLSRKVFDEIIAGGNKFDAQVVSIGFSSVEIIFFSSCGGVVSLKSFTLKDRDSLFSLIVYQEELESKSDVKVFFLR